METKNERHRQFGVINGGPDSIKGERRPLLEGAKFLTSEEAEASPTHGPTAQIGISEDGRLCSCWPEDTPVEHIEKCNEGFRKLAVKENNPQWLDLIVPTGLKPDIKRIK